MIYTMRPDTHPLDAWPAEIDKAHEICLSAGDYTRRGKLIITRPRCVVRGCDHGSSGDAPILAGVHVRSADSVTVRGIQWTGTSALWASNHCIIEDCATYGGIMRMIGDCGCNQVRRSLFHRLTDTGGDRPALYCNANWRWRYADSVKWRAMGQPENDWFPCRTWFNHISDCVFLNYVDGISPASLGSEGWLPWRGTAAGTVVERNVFGMTPDFLSNGESPGENVMCDNKSGGTKQYPLVYRDNLVFGQRKNKDNAICASAVCHIGATNIRFERNVWTDCDSAIGVELMRDESSTAAGRWDTADSHIAVVDNVFDGIRKTSTSQDPNYLKNAGTIFQQGGNVHARDNHLMDCERLAAQHGRFQASTFTGNQLYSDIDFQPVKGRLYTQEDWLRSNTIIRGQPLVSLQKAVPWTDLVIPYRVPR